MKRFVGLLLVIIMIFGTGLNVFAGTGGNEVFPFRRIAMLNMSSSAEGSNINYFVIRPVIGHTDESGETDGTMFDAVILDIGYVPKTPVEAENFITALFAKGANLDAAESAVGDLKDGKYVADDYKYPIFISMPYFYPLFHTTEERNEFCTYFVITFLSVLKNHDFKNIYIAGISFGIEYDAVPDFRNDCAKVVKENGLLSIALTTVSGTVNTDACFAANENIGRRLSVAEGFTGATLKLEAVPSAGDDSALTKLRSDFDKFKNSVVKASPIVFTFNAFNDLYDCAAGLEEAIPNENAREAYDFISNVIDYTGAEEESSVTEVTSEHVDDVAVGKPITSNMWFWVVVVVTVAAAGCLIYYLVIKRKNNDKQ